MTKEEWNNVNHEILQHFLSETEGCQDDVTVSIKCAMALWILNTHRALNLIANKNNGYLTSDDIITTQIQELRQCILDLNESTRFIDNHKEGLQ